MKLDLKPPDNVHVEPAPDGKRTMLHVNGAMVKLTQHECLQLSDILSRAGLRMTMVGSTSRWRSPTNDNDKPGGL